MTIPFIYSPRHSLHHPPVEYLHHTVVPAVEIPARAEHIYTCLTQTDLMTPVLVENPVDLITLSQTHDRDMLHIIQSTSENAAQIVADISYPASPNGTYVYPGIFAIRGSMHRLNQHPVTRIGAYAFDVFAPIGPDTWEAALYSASVALKGAEILHHGNYRIIYALCRPPGHHAGQDFIGGYCYLNNAAIAANYLRRRGRVAILDIDYHHGNGTQDIFWDCQEVFTGSIHADPASEYPYYAGYTEEIGGPDALHTCLNLPLPHGTTGKIYLNALEKLLITVKQFQPSTLIISLGLDTSIEDTTTSFQLKTEDYGAIASAIARLNLPALIIQEGGYNIHANGPLITRFLREFQNTLIHQN